MNKRTRIAWLWLAISVTSVQVVEAQGGIGPILDWINKLSGPAFGNDWALEFYLGGPLVPSREVGFNELGRRATTQNVPVPSAPLWNKLRLRVTGLLVPLAREAQVTGGTIQMETVEVKLEIPLKFFLKNRIELAFAGGLAIHQFSGDVQTFDHVSFPLGLQLRAPVGWPLLVRFGAGFHVFPNFATTDFQPLVVNVKRSGLLPELVFGIFLGFDFDIDGVIRLFR